MRMRWTWNVALAGLCALALAACGSSSHTTPSVALTVPTTTTSTQTTATTTTPPPTTTTGTTTTPAPSGQCLAAGLQLSFLGGQGATGHGLLGFALKDVSTSECHTFGYPGVQFLDKSGATLPTASTRTTHDYFGNAPLRALTVSAGETVSFRLGVTHIGPNGSQTGCTTAYGLQVIPPNDTATLRVAIPQGVDECGTATVSPLQPGTSAFP